MTLDVSPGSALTREGFGIAGLAAAGLGILFLLAGATPALASVPASGAFLAFLTQQATRAPHGQFAAGLASALGLGAVVGALVVLCFSLAAGARRR